MKKCLRNCSLSYWGFMLGFLIVRRIFKAKIEHVAEKTILILAGYLITLVVSVLCVMIKQRLDSKRSNRNA